MSRSSRGALPWLELGLWPGLGGRGIGRLYRKLSSPEAILRRLPADPDRGARRRRAVEALARAERLGASVCALDDPDYPERLRRLVDPPPVLFGLGQPDLLHPPAVAIVGSRRATEYGRSVASALAAALVARGVVVVSGLARGIDSAAHRGALDSGGSTVAVVGGGVGVPPGGRKRLFAEIARAGLVLSEFLPDEHPRPHHFPRRNRILAALSAAVVVVEAGEKSGAHITVRHAVDVGGTIWAVPGPIDRDVAKGCLRLIRDGARVVIDVQEAARTIAAEVELETGRALAPLSDLGSATAGGAGASPIRGAPPPAASRGVEGSRHLRLLHALGSEPTSLDEVTRASGMDVEAVSRGILRLELEGRVRQLPGQRFVRVGV